MLTINSDASDLESSAVEGSNYNYECPGKYFHRKHSIIIIIIIGNNSVALHNKTVRNTQLSQIFANKILFIYEYYSFANIS